MAEPKATENQQPSFSRQITDPEEIERVKKMFEQKALKGEVLSATIKPGQTLSIPLTNDASGKSTPPQVIDNGL